MYRLLFLLFIFLIINCSQKNKLSHEEDCNNVYEKLHLKFTKKKYTATREGYEDFLSTCNGTAFIEQAHYELVQSYYLVKDWAGAEMEAEEFLQSNPNSKYNEIISFQLAQSLAHQIYSVDRDQKNTYRAIEKFEHFAKLFPTSSKLDSANAKKKELYQQLANKEIRIAKLYLKLGEPQAAAIYFKISLKDYKEYIDKNLIYLHLAECYIRLNQINQAKSYLKEVGDLSQESPHHSKKSKLEKKLAKIKKNQSKTS